MQNWQIKLLKFNKFQMFCFEHTLWHLMCEHKMHYRNLCHNMSFWFSVMGKKNNDQHILGTECIFPLSIFIYLFYSTFRGVPCSLFLSLSTSTNLVNVFI